MLYEVITNVEAFIRITTAALEERGLSGKGAGKEGKKLLIRSLVIEEGEIAVQVAALSGKPLSTSLPRVITSYSIHYTKLYEWVNICLFQEVLMVV